MTSNYSPLISETIEENSEPDSQKLKATKHYYRRLASILSVILTALAVTLIVVSTQVKYISLVPVQDNVCVSDECVSSSGSLSSSMDLTINPCDDFYKYSCGKWQDDHPFPRNVDGWSHFIKLSYEMRKSMLKDLENRTIDKNRPRVYDKLYNFYHGCINQTSRNLSGYYELQQKIEAIGGWPSITTNWTGVDYNWEDSLVESIKLKHFPLMRIQVIKDLMDTNKTIIAIGPSSNPEEDFFEPWRIIEEKSPSSNNGYFDMSDQNKETFLKMIENIYDLNNSTAHLSTQIDLDFQNMKELYTKLRKQMSAPLSANYYMKNYQNFKYKVSDLKQRFRGIDFWGILNKLFPSTTIKGETEVFVQDRYYLEHLGDIVNGAEKRVIANYFASTFAMRFGRYTTMTLVNLLVDTLDAPEVLPNICYDLTEAFMPNLLGRLYIDKHFNDSWVRGMSEIIDLIQTSFENSLEINDWMDNSTKTEAFLKIVNIKKNIAYPKWTHNDQELDSYYSKVDIQQDDFFSSVLNVIQSNQDKNFEMLQSSAGFESDAGPIADDSWPSHDATYVNAFYYFSTNGIYFPAGIAQYPFFTYGRPMAMNLGSIGMIIGHEMTHSLDNNGRLYDYRGDLRDWWKNTTRDSFLDKSKCFVNQYNNYSFPEFKMNVNGSRTLAENIADNGGIRKAYEALEMYQDRRAQNNGKFKPLPGKMQKFTEEQLFFISFANIWCSNMMPSAVEKTLKYSAHSPESVRVIGTLANFERFADAFNCSVGTKMNPKDKCILW